MRRCYAFEAEGVSDEVKSQLETVEDAVDDKCETAEDCDKMLEKIDGQAEKFDNALKSMSGAAKDCKDGKCSQDEMTEKITPAMAELKEVAKTIGVAKEGDEGAVTEAELKDVKDYLEGAKEIVEAKKDEIEGGDKKDDSDESDDEPDDSNKDKECEDDSGDETEAEEAFAMFEDLGLESFAEVEMFEDEFSRAIEACVDDCSAVIDSQIMDYAMEGVVHDARNLKNKAMGEIRALRKEMNAAKKSKDYKTAATKAREIADKCDDLSNEVNALPPSTSSAVIVGIAKFVAMSIKGAVIGMAIGAVTGAIATAIGGKSKTPFKDIKDNFRDGWNSGKAAVNGSSSVKTSYGAAKGRKEWDNGHTRTKVGAAIHKATNPMSTAMRRATKNGAGKDISKFAKAGAIGGAVGSGTGMATGTALAFLAKKKVVDEEGNVTNVPVNPNDMNYALAAIRNDIRDMKKKYQDLAAKFDAMASGETSKASEDAATEAFIDYAFEAAINDAVYEMALEGASSDSRAAKKKALSEAKEYGTKGKSLEKSGDMAGAAEAYKSAANACDEAMKEIDSLPSDTTAAVLSHLARALVIVVTTSIGSIIAGGVAGGVAGNAAFKATGDAAAASAAGASAGTVVGVAGTGIRSLMTIGSGICSVVSFLKKEKIVDDNGNVTYESPNRNTINLFIKAAKKDLQKAKDNYLKKASKCESSKGSGEGTKTSDSAAEAFINACEALMIGSSSSKPSNYPFFM